jgi:hypothetical protein
MSAIHKMGGDSVVINTLAVLFSDGTEQTTAYSGKPAVLSTQLLAGLTTPTYPVGLATYTIPTTGFYRISAGIFPTTLNSGPWSVEILAQFSQSGEAGSNQVQVALCTLAAGSATITPDPSVLCYFNAGASILFNTLTASGSENGGVYSVTIAIEQLG